MRNPNLIDKLHAQLPAPARRLLDNLLRLAGQQDVPLFLVGGPLRDLLLDRPAFDLDIAIEGDAIALARDLADATGGCAVTHPRFGTAAVGLGEFHLDLITARSETYGRPGVLPTVEPDTIREDLLRRDFTINAVALRLNGPQRGEILDPAGGLADLDARLVRALHERSFQDDATRILRAFRYTARLGFEIEGQTLESLKRDLRFLDTINGARIHHEFARILAEDEPEQALRALHDHGALPAVHSTLRFDRAHAEAFARLRNLHATGARAAYWPILAWRLTEADARGLALRLALTKPQREALATMPVLEDLEPALAGSASRRDAPKARLGSAGSATTPRRPLPRSAIAEMLALFPLPAVWALTALTDNPTVRDRLLDYLTNARHECPQLTGDDLISMGVPPGPTLGEILRRLRNAKLDGDVSTKGDEARLVEDLMRRGGFQTRPPQAPADAPAPRPARPEALEG